MMILRVHLVILMLFPFFIQGTTIDITPISIPESVKETLSKLTYEIDGYGNIRVKVSNEKDISHLVQLKHAALNDFKQHGLYVHLPIHLGGIGSKLESIGFDLYQIDREKKEISYLFRNERAIPFLDSAFVTASIFIVRINKDGQRELLVIDEYDKKDLTVPAGSVEPGELAIDGIIREVEEEVGMVLSPDRIKLYSIRNRSFKDAKKNHVDFNYYAEVPFDTPVTVDNHEVLNYSWIPVGNIVNNSAKEFGKVFSSPYSEVIKSKNILGIQTKDANHQVVKLRNFS